MSKKKIILASDHAGVDLKQAIIEVMKSDSKFEGFECVDMGIESAGESVDYSYIIAKAAIRISRTGYFGILICGTGIGASITANKVTNLHCALVNNAYTAKMAREHNHVNCIALGARVFNYARIKGVLRHFLFSKPEPGRHTRRVAKIHKLEAKQLAKAQLGSTSGSTAKAKVKSKLKLKLKSK